MKERIELTEIGKKIRDFKSKYLVLATQYIRRVKRSFKKRSSEGWRDFEKVVRRIKRRREGDY